MRKGIFRKVVVVGLTIGFWTCGFWLPAWAEEEKQAQEMEEMVVKGDKQAPQISLESQKAVLDVEAYQGAAIPQNVGDYIKDLPMIDFRGDSELVPDSDTFYLRGFESNRFVNALDGVNIRKTGGRRGSNIVDYALLPPFLIDSIEVMPGPHFALYPGKSIGGTVNFLSKTPQRYETHKPEFAVSTSYGDYATQNHSMSAQGGAGDFTYDLGYQKYYTDGYLRNHEADIDTVFGRVGYILPNEGYITLQTSYADADRQRPVINDPDDPKSDYDSDYPIREKESGRDLYARQKPSWDKIATYHRLSSEVPSPLGTWSAGAYYGEESRDHYDKDSGSWQTHWLQKGVKVSNEFELAENHKTIIGTELEKQHDGDEDSLDERIEILSGFAQHEWTPISSLTLTGGLRFEDVTIQVDNQEDYITGKDAWIERDWSSWSPKSFLTHDLDRYADWLRDTSVSAGVSRIWRAPDYHGDYNPQGRPAGAWLDPEHGVGYDAVLSRRLIKDIQMKLNFFHYRIKDYIASNRKFAEYGDQKGVPDNVDGTGKEYKDYKINLDKMIRQGLEVQLEGSLSDDLEFMLGYAYQDFDNKGGEPAGEEELDNRPEHRVNARLTYQLYQATKLILDYEYQDKQVSVSAEEVAEDEYEFHETDIDAFHVFDLAVEQQLFQEWQGVKDGRLKFYVKNLLDRDYTNSSGYPALDRTMGVGLSFRY
ncbi:MAG: TonB-dependent receptor [Desulfohalobiaceae bacterium]